MFSCDNFMKSFVFSCGFVSRLEWTTCFWPPFNLSFCCAIWMVRLFQQSALHCRWSCSVPFCYRICYAICNYLDSILCSTYFIFSVLGGSAPLWNIVECKRNTTHAIGCYFCYLFGFLVKWPILIVPSNIAHSTWNETRCLVKVDLILHIWIVFYLVYNVIYLVSLNIVAPFVPGYGYTTCILTFVFAFCCYDLLSYVTENMFSFHL